MRTEQGGGERGDEGAERGEEMHAALLNSCFFPPFIPPCQVFFFHSGASVHVNSFSLQHCAILFSKKCKNTEIFTFFVHAVSEACVRPCESDSQRQLSELGH